MLSVPDALAIVMRHARPLPPEITPLATHFLGRVLAEDVSSDIDSPPFDKALMDGYAVRAADCSAAPVVLAVVEEVSAGSTPTKAVEAGQAVRIMTGAPIPAGADAVVMVEQTESLDGGNTVRITGIAPKPGQHILPRAAELKRGEVVLPRGAVLRPQEFGLLAAVGKTAVIAHAAPRVAVLSTGDEVVDAGRKPGPGQIRNSNGPMLVALAARAGGLPHFLGTARDLVESLQSYVRSGLERSAVFILSGGVSAGKLDLVPGVLEQAGVTVHFHKIHIKPGKPLLFGTHGNTLVFGLPGNPASSYVGFELFVKPAIRAQLGMSDPRTRLEKLPLATSFRQRGDRPTYHPVKRERTADGWTVRPTPWLGSADLRALTRADALAVFPAGDREYSAGEAIDVLTDE
jgi:molybdopterin molybdotransferase